MLTAFQVLVELMREQIVFRQNSLYVEVLTILQKNKLNNKEKSLAGGDSDKQHTERTPRKCVVCVSVDHIIAKCPKPCKVNEKQQNKVRFNERGNCALKK